MLFILFMFSFFTYAQLRKFEISGGGHITKPVVVPVGYVSKRTSLPGRFIPFNFGFEWNKKEPHSFQVIYHHLAFYLYNDESRKDKTRFTEQFALLYNRILLSNASKSLLLKSSVGPSFRFWSYQKEFNGERCGNGVGGFGFTSFHPHDSYGIQGGLSGKAILKRRISLTGNISAVGFFHDELPLGVTTELNLGYLFSL